MPYKWTESFRNCELRSCVQFVFVCMVEYVEFFHPLWWFFHPIRRDLFKLEDCAAYNKRMQDRSVTVNWGELCSICSWNVKSKRRFIHCSFPGSLGLFVSFASFVRMDSDLKKRAFRLLRNAELGKCDDNVFPTDEDAVALIQQLTMSVQQGSVDVQGKPMKELNQSAELRLNSRYE